MEYNKEKIIEGFHENLRNFTDPQNSLERTLMIARGLVPIPPKELSLVLFVLTLDDNEEIRAEAEKSIKDIPSEVMNDILLSSTVPEFLDYIARNSTDEMFSQSILLNQNTSDATFAYLADTQTSSYNIDIIANNRDRILRSSEIVEALGKNPAVTRSTIDEVLSYLSIYLGISTDEIYEKDVEEDISDSFLDEVELVDEYVEEINEEDDSDELEYQEVKKSILMKIKSLTIAEKIKIALVGNMEARRILIRDNNRIISTAVLKNPKLTDTEIVTICQSKVVSEDILRQISENRKWTRLYQVKSSLVNNPKTPVHISLNYLRHLRDFDLKALVFNRNLPGVVSSTARKIMKETKSSN